MFWHGGTRSTVHLYLLIHSPVFPQTHLWQRKTCDTGACEVNYHLSRECEDVITIIAQIKTFLSSLHIHTFLFRRAQPGTLSSRPSQPTPLSRNNQRERREGKEAQNPRYGWDAKRQVSMWEVEGRTPEWGRHVLTWKPNEPARAKALLFQTKWLDYVFT